MAENPHVSTEHNLVSETLQMSRLTNGEAGISHHKPNNEVFCIDASTDDGNANMLPDISSVSFLFKREVQEKHGYMNGI